MKILLGTTLLGLKMSNSTFRWSSVITAYLSVELFNYSRRGKYCKPCIRLRSFWEFCIQISLFDLVINDKKNVARAVA